jgi:hypothetical protein
MGKVGSMPYDSNLFARMRRQHSLDARQWGKVQMIILAAGCGSVLALPALSSEYGRVEKNSANSTQKRIARPLATGTAQTAPVSAGKGSAPVLQGSSKAFQLNSDLESLKFTPAAQTSNWNPWASQLSDQIFKPAAQSSLLTSGASSTVVPTQATIDYAEIEKAYEELLPPAAAQARAMAARAGTCGTGGWPLLTPTAIGPMPSTLVQAYGLAHNQPTVGLDNCACDMPMPSASCTDARTVGIYSQANSGMPRTNPGLSNVMNGTAIPGGNAAAAVRMALPTPTFARPSFARPVFGR